MASKTRPLRRSGLAHVRTAGHGQLDGTAALPFGLFVGLGQVQAVQRGLDQAADPLTVGRRNGQHLAQPQLVELGQLRALGHALGLVGGEHGGLAQLAQVIGDVVVLRGQACAGVDHEDHHIGLGHRLTGLLGHLDVDAAFGRGLEAARVDDDELAAAQARVAVVAVAREAGEVGDDGVARLGQPIEQGGLADIGPADQGNDRFHHWGTKP